MKAIKIEKEFVVPGTSVVVEAGDRVVVKGKRSESFPTLSALMDIINPFLRANSRIEALFQDSRIVLTMRGGVRTAVFIGETMDNDFQINISENDDYDFRFLTAAELVAWLLSGNLVKIARWPLKVG